MNTEATTLEALQPIELTPEQVKQASGGIALLLPAVQRAREEYRPTT